MLLSPPITLVIGANPWPPKQRHDLLRAEPLLRHDLGSGPIKFLADQLIG
jgi:hypothetical protein